MSLPVMQPERILLGEQLARNGFINRGRLMWALDIQKENGGRLGEILISQGAIGYFDLYRTIAQCKELPFADLLKNPPSPNLLNTSHIHDYLHLRLIPWRIDNGVTCIAVSEISDEVTAWIKKHYDNNTRIVITSPFDIRKTVEKIFGTSLESASCLSLWEALPHASARQTISIGQKWFLYWLAAIIIALVIAQPIISGMVMIGLCQIAYSLTLLFKCWIFSLSAPKKLSGEKQPPSWDEKLATLDPRDLPIYTVIVPMYKEAASLPGMLAALRGLDYPQHKLDVKLVLESDDTETLEAAHALKPRYHFDIICVPKGVVRTKPKACNYALRFSRGEFVTIFDADDHPEPQQLKKAVYTFRNSPPDVVCLQARLNYYNAGKNILTSFFSLEYTILFNFMLHGLERMGIPIPLGGTSNHIACARLMEEGEWDPFNVTEDADLGTRFAARGYRTIMLDSVTMEEATSSAGAWIRQRSRWIKGYMQTWLVHMRRPIMLKRTLGWSGFIGFQFFVGLSTFTFLTAPVVWMISLLWVGEVTQADTIVLPTWLVCLTLTNMLFNLLTHWSFTVNCLLLYRNATFNIYMAAFLYPLYMIMHSIASYKALWQLIVNPHFWEKTTHGSLQDKTSKLRMPLGRLQPEAIN